MPMRSLENDDVDSLESVRELDSKHSLKEDGVCMWNEIAVEKFLKNIQFPIANMIATGQRKTAGDRINVNSWEKQSAQ